VGDLGVLMIKVIERSMVHEYEQNIAPRHLAEMVSFQNFLQFLIFIFGGHTL
jgi:hypothetical protein